jgi:hypothetical protein
VVSCDWGRFLRTWLSRRLTPFQGSAIDMLPNSNIDRIRPHPQRLSYQPCVSKNRSSSNYPTVFRNVLNLEQSKRRIKKSSVLFSHFLLLSNRLLVKSHGKDFIHTSVPADVASPSSWHPQFIFITLNSYHALHRHHRFPSHTFKRRLLMLMCQFSARPGYRTAPASFTVWRETGFVARLSHQTFFITYQMAIRDTPQKKSKSFKNKAHWDLTSNLPSKTVVHVCFRVHFYNRSSAKNHRLERCPSTSNTPIDALRALMQFPTAFDVRAHRAYLPISSSVRRSSER